MSGEDKDKEKTEDIETTNKAILAGGFSLKRIASLTSWPAVLKFDLTELVYEFQIKEEFATETRRSLVRKYAEVDAKQKPILDKDRQMNVAPERMDEYTKEHKELMEKKVKIPVKKIIVAQKDMPKEVSPLDMALLRDFIKFER